MKRSKTNLVLGRGRLYFDAFAPGTQIGTGEKYMGNTPAFSITRSVESVVRTRSYGGKKHESDPIVVSEKLSASISTDNISPKNFAHWFHATEESKLLPGESFEINIVADHEKLIKIFDTKTGATRSTNITSLRVYRGIVEVPLLGNFDTRMLQYGLLSILENARDVFDGDRLRLVVRTGESKVAPLDATNKALQGSLRFLSNNIVGPDFDYFFPLVTVTPSGSIDLKGDEFQQMVFTIEVMKLSPVEDYYHIRVLEKFTMEEQIIIDQPSTLEEFVRLESMFNDVMQIGVPELFLPVRPLRLFAPFPIRGPNYSGLFYSDAALDGLMNESYPETTKIRWTW